MNQFNKIITIGKEKRLFQFTYMRNMSGVKFFVTTHDDNKKAIAFSLKQKDNADWKLLPGAARWLYEIESQLAEAITDTRV